MLQQEEPLVASKTRVPAEKAVAAGGHELAEIVLREIHVVVGGDERRGGTAPFRPVVKALTGHEACPVARRGRRVQRNSYNFV